MMDSTSGQGGDNYDYIGPANHLDYQKWNNHQRKEATSPTFKVIGQFFGLDNLFAMTHDIFQESWIYYRDRADLIGVDANNEICNLTEQRVYWNGQAELEDWKDNAKEVGAC